MRLTFLCLLLFLSPAFASAQMTLAWNWAPGQHLDLQMEQAAVSTTMLEARELPGRSTAALRLAWQVLEVNAQSEAAIEQRIVALSLSVEIPGEAAMKFDTADEKSISQNPEFARAFAALTADAARLRVDRRGRILAIETSPAVEQALRRLPRRVQVGELLTRDGMQKLFGQTFPLLPEAAVQAGDRWQSQVETTTAMGRFRFDTDYLLEGPLAEMPQLQRVSVISRASPIAGSAPPGVEVNVIEQQSEGAFLFDVPESRLRESRLKREMTLEIVVGESRVRQKLVTDGRLTVAPVEARP